jgi:hypothetical protein
VIENVVVGFENPIREPVIAHVLPDIFDLVELRRFRRQRQEGDVGGNQQLLLDMPPCLIEDEDGVRATRDRKRKFLEMESHGLAVA